MRSMLVVRLLRVTSVALANGGAAYSHASVALANGRASGSGFSA